MDSKRNTEDVFEVVYDCVALIRPLSHEGKLRVVDALAVAVGDEQAPSEEAQPSRVVKERRAEPRGMRRKPKAAETGGTRADRTRPEVKKCMKALLDDLRAYPKGLTRAEIRDRSPNAPLLERALYAAKAKRLIECKGHGPGARTLITDAGRAYPSTRYLRS